MHCKFEISETVSPKMDWVFIARIAAFVLPIGIQHMRRLDLCVVYSIGI